MNENNTNSRERYQFLRSLYHQAPLSAPLHNELLGLARKFGSKGLVKDLEENMPS